VGDRRVCRRFLVAECLILRYVRCDSLHPAANNVIHTVNVITANNHFAILIVIKVDYVIHF